MITSLRLLNVKGLTGDFTLTPITVVTGKNSVGKTAILTAIRLSLLGYEPSIGKQHSATFTLSSGSRMAVIADGRTFKWEEKRLKVVSEFPEGFTPAPETMLDLSGLFSMSREQRMVAIMRACHMPEGMDTADLVRQVTTVCPSFKFPVTTGKVLEDTDAIAKALAAHAKALKERVEEYQAASTRHAEEMAKIPVVSGPREEAISEKNQQLGSVRLRIKQAKNSDSHRAGLTKQVNSMVIPDEAALKEQIVELEAQLAIIPEVQEAEINSEYDPKLKELREKLGETRGLYRVLKSQLDNLAGSDECPTCGHPVTEVDINERKARLDKIQQEGIALNDRVQKLEREVAEKRHSAGEASIRREGLRRKIAVVQEQIRSIPALTSAKEALLDQIKALEVPTALDALESEAAALQASIEALQQEQRYYTAAQNLQRTADLAVKHRKEHEEKLETCKLAKDIVQEFRVQTLAVVAKTVLNVANRVVEPCLGRKLELTDDDFSIGKASLATLSGSEKMVVYAGLQIALSAAHEPKIVLMDELGVIDMDRKEKLLKVVAELIADKTISQFVGVDINPLPGLGNFRDTSLISL